MPVAFDNTVATVLFNRRAGIPPHPETGQPIEMARQRIEGLVRKLQKEKERIIIPTPVIAELLTVAGPDGTQYFDTITRSKQFQVGDFDVRAALEVSLMNATALVEGDKKDGIDAPWQKIKVDRQIVAICKVNNVSVLYTDDGSLRRTAEKVGLTTMGIHELPIPDEDRQGNLLEWEAHEEVEEAPHGEA